MSLNPVTNRRRFVGSIASFLLARPLVVGGQSAARVYRLGILRLGRFATDDAYSFPVLLGDLGYVEGRNLVVERRSADGKSDRMPGLARELVDLRVDAILAVGSVATAAAKVATPTIPVVFLDNGDPVAAGLVQSLARPGGNITGVLITPEGASLAGKRVELLRESVPRAARIALLAPDQQGVTWSQAQETRAAASSLRLGLDVVEVVDGDYARAFATIAALRPQALVVGANGGFVRDRKTIIELAARYRLPAIYEWPRQVKDGGLMSYGANDLETYRQVASYIDRLFKGAKPSDMPIWLPSKLHLVLNLKTARALGLTIPRSVLLRADEVIRE